MTCTTLSLETVYCLLITCIVVQSLYIESMNHRGLQNVQCLCTQKKKMPYHQFYLPNNDKIQVISLLNSMYILST